MPKRHHDYVVPDLTRLDREACISLALEAICTSPLVDGKYQLSIRQAASDFDVPRSTLHTRFHGVKSRVLAHEHQQNLTQAQEKVLVDWIKVQGRRGVPISPATLGDYASAISGTPIGKIWPHRFMARHPDLKTRWTRSLEKCRANNVNHTTVNGFYDIYEDIIKQYNVPRKNIYNMDEKGIQLGVGKDIAAIVDRDQKNVYKIEDGNRELVTVIECVCADGTSIPPSVIFKGKRVNLEWGKNNPLNASVSCSPNGWTDQELGLNWLKKDFEPFTAKRNISGAARVLILDGHNSYCTYDFCHFAETHNIIILCLPSHTTHVLQPCDVCVFGPLSTFWKGEVNKAAGHVPITKSNLLEHYARARQKAFKSTTIETSFRKTGLWPFNRDALDPIVFEPSLNTTTQAALPLSTDIATLIVPVEISPPIAPVAPIDPDSPPAEIEGPQLASPTKFSLAIPNPVPHTATRSKLYNQNKKLFLLLRLAEEQIQADYAKLKLMEKEYKKIRERAFAKEKKKGKDKRESAEARHMTSEEVLQSLARADWEAEMKVVFKGLKEKVKAREKLSKEQLKRVQEQEKREQALIKEREAAEKKVEAVMVKAFNQWRKDMNAMGGYCQSEIEKAKKKAGPERTRRLARERVTPKRRGQGQRARRRKASPSVSSDLSSLRGSDRDSLADCTTPIPVRRTCRQAAQASQAATAALLDEGQLSPPIIQQLATPHQSTTSHRRDTPHLLAVPCQPITPKPKPKPRPRPRPIVKSKVAVLGNVQDTEAAAAALAAVSDMLESDDEEEQTHLPHLLLVTPGRETRRTIRFQIEPLVINFSNNEDESLPASPTVPCTRGRRLIAPKELELSHQPNRNTQLESLAGPPPTRPNTRSRKKL